MCPTILMFILAREGGIIRSLAEVSVVIAVVFGAVAVVVVIVLLHLAKDAERF